MHQGAENSALKNNAPSSLTTFRTSERTSIFGNLPASGVCGKNTGRSIKYSRQRPSYSAHVFRGPPADRPSLARKTRTCSAGGPAINHQGRRNPAMSAIGREQEGNKGEGNT